MRYQEVKFIGSTQSIARTPNISMKSTILEKTSYTQSIIERKGTKQPMLGKLNLNDDYNQELGNYAVVQSLEESFKINANAKYSVISPSKIQKIMSTDVKRMPKNFSKESETLTKKNYQNNKVERKVITTQYPTAAEIWEKIDWMELRKVDYDELGRRIDWMNLGPKINSIDYEKLAKQIDWLEVGPKMQHYFEIRNKPVTLIDGKMMVKTKDLVKSDEAQEVDLEQRKFSDD